MNAPPLTPFPMHVLMGRIAHEWATRSRIFDLPIARFWSPEPDVDLTMTFLGRPAATPLGPAAGPHSQMAQNIVLAWLGGARMFELKTVQVLDDLEIGRPCIDMQTIGYNIEWSQELKVHQSLEEYVKAWMAIEMLRRWEPISEHIGDAGPHVFDMSVGYDLAGISTEKIGAFIDGLMDATSEIDRLRPHIPEPFVEWRDFDFPSRIADTVTLSTFHGCPPEEIEGITKHLMTRHGTDVVVKLNPTLLGHARVQEIVNDMLGYDFVQLDPKAFDDDLQFDRGIELIGELREFAAANGRRFGMKLTNTLVVRNHKGFMPDDPMYLSGPPLHVLAMTLLDRLSASLPGVLQPDGGDVQVSFSAGVTRDNVSETVGVGVAPATICSDLLKPGGYGRLAPMLKRLADDMRTAGATNLDEWRAHATTAAVRGGFRGAAQHHVTRMLAGDENQTYHREANEKLPREVDHTLEMWGCVACNFCVTVCPNDAFFRLPTPEDSGLDGRQQYLVLTELCNECGNCMVFCPEDGDPAIVKPRLFIDRERFDLVEGQAFFLDRTDGELRIEPKSGWESEVPMLRTLLTAEEGLPIRVSDL
ncbi:MAG TPA: 4Fe-4S dicluster domain-containing protein [Acidimicrobiia bacterium]|nr:4Fe-4S dicluster domain-containing protein [Acidimicrobiia bacterium]